MKVFRVVNVPARRARGALRWPCVTIVRGRTGHACIGSILPRRTRTALGNGRVGDANALRRHVLLGQTSGVIGLRARSARITVSKDPPLWIPTNIIARATSCA